MPTSDRTLLTALLSLFCLSGCETKLAESSPAPASPPADNAVTSAAEERGAWPNPDIQLVYDFSGETRKDMRRGPVERQYVRVHMDIPYDATHPLPANMPALLHNHNNSHTSATGRLLLLGLLPRLTQLGTSESAWGTLKASLGCGNHSPDNPTC